MKRSLWILPLALAGLALLIGSLFFFNYPPFGLIIFSIILSLFVGTTWRYFFWLRDVEAQTDWILRQGDDFDANAADAPRELQYRLREINASMARGEDPRRIDFADLLSTRESARGITASGSTLIVLGLMGTFYGLLNVVSVAGAATASQHLDLAKVLPQIFANLQGIFGSSLSGLSASLLLGAMQGFWHSAQGEYLAEVEAFCRFRLLPKLAPQQEAPSEDPVVEEIRALRREWQNELWQPIQQSLRQTAQNNQEVLNGLQQNIQGFFADLGRDLNQSWSQQARVLWDQQNTDFKSQQDLYLKSAAEFQTELQGRWKQDQSEQQILQQKMLDNLQTWQSRALDDWDQSRQKLDDKLGALIQSLQQNQQRQGDLWLQNAQQTLGDLQNQLVQILSSQATSIQNQSAELGAAVRSLQQGLEDNLPLIAQLGDRTASQLDQKIAEILAQQSQAQAQLQQSQAAWSEQVQAMAGEWDQLRQQGLAGLLESLQSAAQGSQDGLIKLAQGLDAFQSSLSQTLESQGSLSASWQSSLDELRIHQIELQASMEHFRAGTEYMVEHFGSEKRQGDDLLQKQAHWEQLILSYQDKLGEILRDNALKTREILAEIMTQRGH